MKLTVIHLVKKFHAVYGTRGFITMFTTARYWTLSWASLIQSIPSEHSSVLILSSRLYAGLPAYPLFHAYSIYALIFNSRATGWTAWVRFPAERGSLSLLAWSLNHLNLLLPSSFFPSGFSTKICIYFSSSFFMTRDRFFSSTHHIMNLPCVTVFVFLSFLIASRYSHESRGTSVNTL
jgi:hypothetical protein